MQPKASFVQIGSQYFATVILPGKKHEEIIQDRAGKNIPFDSATRAQQHATQFLVNYLCPPIRSEIIVKNGDEEHNMIKDWKARKADEVRRSKDLFALRRTVVVRKRKFAKVES